MSYQAPLLIREPELRWPIVILAAIITTIIALVAAGLHYVAMTQPVNSYSGPRLSSALRPGEPEFVTSFSKTKHLSIRSREHEEEVAQAKEYLHN